MFWEGSTNLRTLLFGLLLLLLVLFPQTGQAGGVLSLGSLSHDNPLCS